MREGGGVRVVDVVDEGQMLWGYGFFALRRTHPKNGIFIDGETVRKGKTMVNWDEFP